MKMRVKNKLLNGSFVRTMMAATLVLSLASQGFGVAVADCLEPENDSVDIVGQGANQRALDEKMAAMQESLMEMSIVGFEAQMAQELERQTLQIETVVAVEQEKFPGAATAEMLVDVQPGHSR